MSELWTIQVVFLKSRLYNRPGQNASLFCGGSFGGGKNKKSASRFSLIAREKFRSRKSPDANRMWAQPTANWVQAQPASLRYPSPKNSPPDCFYSRISASAAGSFESPSFQFNKKSDPTMWDHFFGGKRGIRTLGAFIGHTRFPVVRLRPAQPSFHNGFCCVHSTCKCLIIISGRSKKVKHFLEKNGEIFRRVDGQPKV